LFASIRDTLYAFAADPKHPGAEIGYLSVLHTWGQTLVLHPHVHCIVPAGGITVKGNWKHARGKGRYTTLDFAPAAEKAVCKPLRYCPARHPQV
jgi:hypothetical protein